MPFNPFSFSLTEALDVDAEEYAGLIAMMAAREALLLSPCAGVAWVNDE